MQLFGIFAHYLIKPIKQLFINKIQKNEENF